MPSKKPKIVRVAKPTISVSESNPSITPPGDGDFLGFRRMMQAAFASLDPSLPLFCVEGTSLYDAFRDNLPTALRQHYDCRACRQFVERFGGIVVVNEAGQTASPLWRFEAAEPYAEAVTALRAEVERRPIVTAHVSSELEWGVAKSNGWDHLAISPPRHCIHADRTQTAFQAAALIRENKDTLGRAVDEFSIASAEKAHLYLSKGDLYRAEKSEGMAAWFLAMHRRLAGTRGQRRLNLLWSASATAPAGWCNVKSGMLGTLLEDIEAGLPLKTIAAKWSAKMEPTKYMRPTAAPAAQNLQRAEKIVAQLQSAGALDRRFARIEDVAEKLWSPRVSMPKTHVGPVFGGIAAKRSVGQATSDLPEKTMTWEKFRDSVLESAERIEFYVPIQNLSYMALLTSSSVEAPPILQWDGMEGKPRNPVSWYVYQHGSRPEQWMLEPHTFVNVRAITPLPAMWHGNELGARHGERVIFLLEGCRDSRAPSLSLFPEIMRGEYHEVRASIEAYSRDNTPSGRELATACGVSFNKGQPDWGEGCRLRVTDRDGTRRVYRLDRWE